MSTAQIHTAVLTARTGQVRRVLVAVRELLPGHLVYNPPITLQPGETLRFDPPLEAAIHPSAVRPSGNEIAETTEDG